MKPLVLPPAAQRDDQAVQMLTAWIAERGLHCTLNIGMWGASGVDEPRAWGKLLADVARHIGNALHEQTGVTPAEAVDSVVRAFIKELGEPTSDAAGHFHVRAH
jgi:hypothetical protein